MRVLHVILFVFGTLSAKQTFFVSSGWVSWEKNRSKTTGQDLGSGIEPAVLPYGGRWGGIVGGGKNKKKTQLAFVVSDSQTHQKIA